MNQRELQEKLDSVECLTFLDTKQQGEVEDLLEHPGLMHVLGLLAGARQAQLLQLSHMNLASEAGRYQTAVIQGQTKALDLVAQTLLELVPAAEATEQKRN